jgi:hypothetical protein
MSARRTGTIRHVVCPRCGGSGQIIFCVLCQERRQVSPYLADRYTGSDRSIETAIKLRHVCAATDNKSRS